MKATRYKTLCLLVIIGLFAVPQATFAQQASDDSFELTIIHTNDFHGYDYDLLARKSTIIKQVRAANQNVLLLEGGDIFSRGKYHYVFYGTIEMAVLNLLNYDAWVLGNNEMKCTPTQDSTDYRVGVLIQMAQFPTLSGNMVMKADNSYIAGTKPYTFVERNGVKIAIISTTSMKIRGYAQAQNKLIIDPLTSARKQLAEVKSQSDVQILLSHSGILADKIMGDSLGTEGLDAIVGADTHIALEHPFMSSSGVPIVQAGGEANQFVGVLKLYFRKENDEWKLIKNEGELIKPKEDIEKDSETEQLINQYINAL